MTLLDLLINKECNTPSSLYTSILESLGDTSHYYILSANERALLNDKLNILIQYMNDGVENDIDFNSFIKCSSKTSVDNIKVTTSTGKVFDGDEKSQDRMVRAIQIASITGQTTTNWKLADNSIVMVTLEELKEALTLAGQEMSELWLND